MSVKSITPEPGDTPWSSELTYLTERLVSELVDEKIITLDPENNTNKVSSAIQRALEKIVLPLAERREDTFKGRLQKTTQLLSTTEEECDARITQLRSEHTAKLGKVDDVIKGQNVRIEDLTKEVSGLKRDISKQESSQEAYIENLHNDHSRIKKENERLQSELTRSQSMANERGQELRKERSHVEKLCTRIDSLEEKERMTRLVVQAQKMENNVLQTEKTAADHRVQTLENLVKEKLDEIERLTTESRSIDARSRTDSFGNSQIHGDGTALDAEIAAGELREKTDEIEELTSELNSSRERVLSLKLQVVEHGQTLKETNEKLKNTSEKLEETKKALTEAQKPKTEDLDAALAKCNEEKAEMVRQLEEARQRHDKALSNTPDDADLRELRERLRQAEDDLREARAEAARIQSLLDARTAEFTRQTRALSEDLTAALSQINNVADGKSDRESTAIYITIIDDLRSHANEAMDKFAAQTTLSKATRSQYVERLRRLQDEIKRNPNAPDAAVSRKKAAGVEKEIDRMNGIIKTLREERQWLQDTLDRSESARGSVQRRTDEALASAEAARAQVENLVAQTEAALAGAVAPQNAEAGPILVRLTTWLPVAPAFFYFNTFAALLMLLTSLATAREYGAIRTANAAVRRAVFGHSLDKTVLSINFPTYELSWEFLFFIGAGYWKWRA